MLKCTEENLDGIVEQHKEEEPVPPPLYRTWWCSKHVTFSEEAHPNFLIKNFREIHLLPVPVTSRLKFQSPTSCIFYFVSPTNPASLIPGVPNTSWCCAPHQLTNTPCHGSCTQGPHRRQTPSSLLGQLLVLPGHRQGQRHWHRVPRFQLPYLLQKSKHKWTSGPGIIKLIHVSQLKQVNSG